jgi:hypothetical protein
MGLAKGLQRASVRKAKPIQERALTSAQQTKPEENLSEQKKSYNSPKFHTKGREKKKKEEKNIRYQALDFYESMVVSRP